MKLTDAPLGVMMTVLNVAPKRAERATRLAAMGIVCGIEVRVRQRRPAIIVEYEETTLAIDSEIAAEIDVEVTVESIASRAF